MIVARTDGPDWIVLVGNVRVARFRGADGCYFAAREANELRRIESAELGELEA